MSERIVRREHVSEGLSISFEVLARYESLGLIRSQRDPEPGSDAIGYLPAEVNRIWSILSYQRDLGVNLAGVEVILRLRDRMDHAQHQLAELAQALEALATEAESARSPGTPSEPGGDSDA